MSKLSENITEPAKKDYKSFLEGFEDVPVTLVTMSYDDEVFGPWERFPILRSSPW